MRARWDKDRGRAQGSRRAPGEGREPARFPGVQKQEASKGFPSRPRQTAVAVRFDLAGPTRLELAPSDVTGRRYNQLNYGPRSLDNSW